MNDFNTVSNVIFTEFAILGKYVAVHVEGNILNIRVGTSDVKIMNWENEPIQSILTTTRNSVVKENFVNRTLILG